MSAKDEKKHKKKRKGTKKVKEEKEARSPKVTDVEHETSENDNHVQETTLVTEEVVVPPTKEKKGFLSSLFSFGNDKKTKTASPPPTKVASSFTPSKATKEATNSLIKHYTTIVQHKNYPNEGFEVEMVDDNVYKWHIKLGQFDKDTQIFQDMFLYESERAGRDHVLLEAIFPSSWPHKPPFLRVVYPRFHQYTGHITLGGSICVKELTSSGWNKDIELPSLFIMIRNLLLEGSALIDMDSVKYDYTEEEARSAFDRVAKAHGWTP